jgi:hypothetical protein
MELVVVVIITLCMSDSVPTTRQVAFSYISHVPEIRMRYSNKSSTKKHATSVRVGGSLCEVWIFSFFCLLVKIHWERSSFTLLVLRFCRGCTQEDF